MRSLRGRAGQQGNGLIRLPSIPITHGIGQADLAFQLARAQSRKPPVFRGPFKSACTRRTRAEGDRRGAAGMSDVEGRIGISAPISSHRDTDLLG